MKLVVYADGDDDMMTIPTLPRNASPPESPALFLKDAVTLCPMRLARQKVWHPSGKHSRPWLSEESSKGGNSSNISNVPRAGTEVQAVTIMNQWQRAMFVTTLTIRTRHDQSRTDSIENRTTLYVITYHNQE